LRKPRLIYCVLAILLWTGLAGLAGCARPGRLLWQLKPGDTYSVKVNLNSNLSMMFPGVDNRKNEMQLTCRVKALDQEKHPIVEATITSLKASMQSLGVSASFDSEDKTTYQPAKDDKNKQRTQKYIDAFIDLKGKKYNVLMGDETQLAKLLDVDDPIRKIMIDENIQMDILRSNEQAHMLLTENHLMEYVTGGLIGGDTAIKIEHMESWSTCAITAVPEARTSIRKNYTIESAGETLSLQETPKEKETPDPKKQNKEQDKKQPSSKTKEKPTDKNQKKEPPELIPEIPQGRNAVVSYQITKIDQEQTATEKSKGKTKYLVTDVEGQGKLIFSLDKKRMLKLAERMDVSVTSRQQAGSKAKAHKKVTMCYNVNKTIEYMYD